MTALSLLFIADHDIHPYTDGSSQGQGIAAGGYIAYQAGQKILSGCFRLDKYAGAVEAEIAAITEGLESSVKNCPTQFARNIVIFTDNKTAAAICQGLVPISSQARALRIRQLQENWPLRDRLPHVTKGAIMAEWISGHSGNTGTAEADRLAKEGTKLLAPAFKGYTYAASKKLGNLILKKQPDDWWEKHALARYKRLGIKFNPKPRELFLSRTTLNNLISARTSHGDFEKYHMRFQHQVYDPCKCGVSISSEHFFYCKLKRKKARNVANKRRTKEAIDWLPGSECGASAFASIWTSKK